MTPGTDPNCLGIHQGDETPDPAPSPPPREGVDPIQRFSGVPLLFLVDLPTLDQTALDRLREVMTHFLNHEVAPADQVLLASIGKEWKVEQSLTRDVSSVLQALTRMRPMWDSHPPFRQFTRELRIVTSLNFLRLKTQSFLSKIGRRVRDQTQALGSLSQLVRPLAGRKSLIFFAAGYPENAPEIVAQIVRKEGPGGRMLPFNRDSLRGFSPYARGAAYEANQSQVAIYSVDPGNLFSVENQDSSKLSVGVRNWVRKGDVTGPRAFLRDLSSVPALVE